MGSVMRGADVGSRRGRLDGLARKLTFVEPKLASKVMSARDELKPIESTGLTGRSSATADVGAGWVLRQQCDGLLTVAASSSPTAASCRGELILPTQ
jgi:hypothetical protein